MIIQSILLLLFILNTMAGIFQQYCQNYQWVYQEDGYFQKLDFHFVGQYQSEDQIKLGIGFWFSYRPLDNSQIKNYEQIDSRISSIDFFLYKFQSLRFSSTTVIFSYLEMNQELQVINLVTLVQTLQGYVQKKITIEIFSLDGDWSFIYFFMDQTQKKFTQYYYSNINHMYSFVEVENFFQLTQHDVLISTSRYYVNEQIDNQMIQTKSLQGIFFQLISTTENLFSDIDNFYSDCLPKIYCNQRNKLLISHNIYFSGLNSTIIDVDQLQNNYFSITGWVKQDILVKVKKLDSLLLRITINQQFFDDSQIGDRLLYVIYHQSQILSNNGFTFETYSYDFPVKQNFYNTQQSDIIQFLSSELSDVQANWHFFQYYEGSNENNGYPFVRIFYPAKDQTFTYKWNNDIHHYTNVKLYFHIGGDDYFQNQFKGYLSDWTIKTFCEFKYQIVLNIPCHYSCLTCKGVSSSDCLSCLISSNRLFSKDENKCTCPIEFIDMPNVVECQLLQEINLIFEPVEMEIQCEKIGYFQCEEKMIECEFGYFKYNQQCIQCPQYDNLKSQTQINCPDCFIYPDAFSQNLQCSFWFESENENEPYQYNLIGFSQIELYQIIQNDLEQYILQHQLGKYLVGNAYQCKPGYFQNQNENCQICPPGCTNCNHSKTCSQCDLGYYMIEEQQCVLCTVCQACVIYDGEQMCYSLDNCRSNQYWFNNKCYNCGENCQACSINQCYYCCDNSKYYITLDKINCSLCPIKNCKYCFEYIKSDTTINLSLDISIYEKFDARQQKISLGCAQCYDGFYFSLVTSECELKPLTEQDCQIGLISQDSKTICLKSQTLSNSIQSVYCDKIENCQECINNYTQKIQQFCIICQEGYYSTVLTGQCKLCPFECRTCGQQLSKFLDNWKQDIKAFYKYFANSDGNHPFETNAAELDSNSYQISCLSCSDNYILYNNTCLKGCDQNCLDCRIVINILILVPYSQCFKCKSSTYSDSRGLQANTNIDSQNVQITCMQCAPFCEACYPRTENEIRAINPFFNQTSKYLPYSNICYKYLENSQYQTIMLPKYFSPQICANSKKCMKAVNLNYIIFCDLNQFSDSFYINLPDNQKHKYFTPYEMLIMSALSNMEVEYVFDYLNSNLIQIVNYKISFPQPMTLGTQCYTDYLLKSTLPNALRQYAFYINTITLNMFGETEKINFQLTMSLEIKNFDKIIFDNFQFLMPQKDPDENIYKSCRIKFLNDYIPIEIIIKNCYFMQEIAKQLTLFEMTSNRLKLMSLVQIEFIQLQIYNSAMFQFSPLNTYNDSTLNVQNLTILKSVFKNSSIFSLQAVNNSLISITNIKDVFLTSTIFIGSCFLNSTYKLSFDIGIINLENIYLENITFQNNSVFLYAFAALQIRCNNITLKNVKFYDNSSFFFGNTFEISKIQFQSCSIEQGSFISNNGEVSKSQKVIESSNLIQFQSFLFDDITYISEKSLIFIISNFSSALELQIFQLKLNDCKYIDSEQGKFSFDHLYYKFSLIYLECFTCKIENITIIRGYGRPEISIIQTQNLLIKNIFITLKKDYFNKALHEQFKCIKQFNFLNMYFVISISSFQSIQIENVLVEEMLIFDYPIIQIEGLVLNQEAINKISMNNLVFENNILIITQLNRLTSAISISCQQTIILNIQNSTFSNNLVKKYEDDIQMHSASTLNIELQTGNVTLYNVIFNQNVIYGSADSTLFIKASTLTLVNCIFQGQNIFNAELLQKNILLQKKQDTDLNQTLRQLFSPLSYGGSGYFLLNQLDIRSCQINNSKAANGGGFYIVTSSAGQISIINSLFQRTITLLSANLFSSGGALYIDSSKSQLNISIINSSFDQSYSKAFGGAVYIDTSKITNEILIQNVSFRSCFSFQHSAISFSPSQLQQLNSSVKILNSQFKNTKQEFELYLSNIQDFQDSNIDSLQYQNPLIYLQFCNVTIYNCQFQEIHLANLIQIEKSINLILEQIQIENCTILYFPLIQISNSERYQATFIFKDIILVNNQDFQNDQNFICNNEQSQATTQLICPNQISDFSETIQSDNEIVINNCSLKRFYTISANQFSLITFMGFQNNDQIYIANVIIKNNICLNCYTGLLNINGYNFTDNFFIITDLQIENNQCGFLGCLTVFQTFNNSLLENSNQRILTQFLNQELEFKLNFQVQLKLLQSTFINNTAQYGAACFFAQINIFLYNCLFKQNKAQQKGGAIYFYSSTNKIYLVNTQIVENEAQIAGGLYNNQSSIQQEKHFNLVMNSNQANMFANNLLSIPCKLSLKINGIVQNSVNLITNSTTIIDEVIINPYYVLGSPEKTKNLLLPSGLVLSNYQYFDVQQSIYIPYNFTFRLIASNQKNEQILNLSGSSCKIFTEILKDGKITFQEFKYLDGSLSLQTINFNLSSGDYNMDNLIIYFNPNSDQSSQLQLAFKCDSIQIPQYNSQYPYELQNIILNYYLVLKLRTFNCQLGEYLNTTSGGCVLCDISQNQFSIIKDAIQCEFKDELKMKNIQPAMIELREGYWRAFYNSQIIEECYHLYLNCLGGWIAGDQSCNFGHLGALCEQCDVYNIRGYGSFSQSQNYSCSDCNKMAANIINIFLALLWTLLSIFLSVNSTIKMIEEFILYTKLKAFGKYLIFQAAQISILIKVFTNYLQIINSLTTFQLSIPIGITIVFSSVGNPIETVSFSLDCYFVKFTNLGIIYVRILWCFAQVGMFILLFLILHLIIMIINKKKMSLTFLTTTLIYIYIYLSPNIVSGLIALMSYRTISGEKWVTSNVSYLYDSQQHFSWLMYFILPAFIIVSLIMPFFFFSILYYHRKKIHLSKVRKVWGYLYNEYKQETYYWEIIKIIQKELIILVLVYYVDYVSIKSSLIFFLLYLYGYLTNKYRPYQTGDLNQIDSFQTSICKISIILAQTIYSAQKLNLIEILGPFYLFLAIVNLIFIVQIISKIFYAYFDKLYQQIDYLKSLLIIRFPYIIKSNKFCLKLFSNTTERKQLIRQRFLLIKSYLLQQARQIVVYKKLNNLDQLPQKNKESSFVASQTHHNSNPFQRINTARLSNAHLFLKSTDQ